MDVCRAWLLGQTQRTPYHSYSDSASDSTTEFLTNSRHREPHTSILMRSFLQRPDLIINKWSPRWLSPLQVAHVSRRSPAQHPPVLASSDHDVRQTTVLLHHRAKDIGVLGPLWFWRARPHLTLACCTGSTRWTTWRQCSSWRIKKQSPRKQLWMRGKHCHQGVLHTRPQTQRPRLPPKNVQR